MWPRSANVPVDIDFGYRYVIPVCLINMIGKINQNDKRWIKEPFIRLMRVLFIIKVFKSILRYKKYILQAKKVSYGPTL